MPEISEKLESHLKDAMRARDEVRLRTIRSLRAALKDREIAERTASAGPLSADQELAVLQKQAKQRQDAIDQYESAGRDDLASREREELEIIRQYLPAQLDVEEIRSHVQRLIQETGAKGMQDMGRVMGAAMQQLRGRADGRQVQQLVKEELERGS